MVRRITDKYIYFDSTDTYSNSWPSKLEVDGQIFSCVEQGFQYGKARFFGDSKIASEIRCESDPAKCRELGRRVNKFSTSDWVIERRNIMFRYVHAKFSQDPLLKEMILGTDFKHFVRLGSDDYIWSVGLDIDAPGLDNFSRWPGLNLLGGILVDVRESLRLTQYIGCGLM